MHDHVGECFNFPHFFPRDTTLCYLSMHDLLTTQRVNVLSEYLDKIASHTNLAQALLKHPQFVGHLPHLQDSCSHEMLKGSVEIGECLLLE
jgi:hypothetical protein